MTSSVRTLDPVRPERPTVDDIRLAAERLVADVERAVRGKPDVVRLSVACLLARGHLLLEDAPGLGKTVLARALARSLGLTARRIQLTPDLLPSDLTGGHVLTHEQQFEFREGPIFAHVVVADEINRASPKTQSALLEVMEEGRVTVDGQPFVVEPPFLIMATQNPIEVEGTFPLPEAQLDRFMMKLSLGYADRAAECEVLAFDGAHGFLSAAKAEVTDPEAPQRVQALIDEVARLRVPAEVDQYIVELAWVSRRHDRIAHGASTRATVALRRAAQAWAAMEGRGYVLPDDVRALVPFVWPHRLVPASRVGAEEARAAALAKILEVPVPR
jgi:MoxR-like ATPase